MASLPEFWQQSSRCDLVGADPAQVDLQDVKTKPLPVMTIELARETIKEMQRSVKGGKGIHLTLGKTPLLRFGNAIRELRSAPVRHRQELYFKKLADHNHLELAGVVTHELAMEAAKVDATAGDAALEKLKASMAEHKKEKESNQATFIDAIPSKKALSNSHTATKQALLFQKRQGLGNSASRSMPTSPAPSPMMPATSSKLASASSSQSSSSAAEETAVTEAVRHLLAVRPTSKTEILKKTRAPQRICDKILGKIATVDEKSDICTLRDKSYLDLNLWIFQFRSQEDRQAAIDNSVTAFDRMRIPPSDPRWDKLNPANERGKGKCLSKFSKLQANITKEAQPSSTKPLGDHRSTLKTLNGMQSARSRSSEGVRPKKSVEKEADSKKKTAPKPTKKDSKIKSAEFIESSDEQSPPPEPAVDKKRKAEDAPHGVEGSDGSAPAKRNKTASGEVKKVDKPAAKTVKDTQPISKPIAHDTPKPPTKESKGPAKVASATTKAAGSPFASIGLGSRTPPIIRRQAQNPLSPKGSAPSSAEKKSVKRPAPTENEKAEPNLTKKAKINQAQTAAKRSPLAATPPMVNYYSRSEQSASVGVKRSPEREASPAVHNSSDLNLTSPEFGNALDASSSQERNKETTTSPASTTDSLRSHLDDLRREYQKAHTEYLKMRIEIDTADGGPSDFQVKKAWKKFEELEKIDSEIREKDPDHQSGKSVTLKGKVPKESIGYLEKKLEKLMEVYEAERKKAGEKEHSLSEAKRTELWNMWQEIEGLRRITQNA